MHGPHAPARLPLRGRVVVCRADAEAWHLLFVTGSQADGGAAVERTQTVPLADRAGLAQAIARGRVRAVLRVVPAGSVVVRPVGATPPAGNAAQVRSALDLVAEAQLGGTFAAHRRGGLGLAGAPGGPGETFALGWSGEHTADALDDERVARLAPQVWVPEPVALAGLCVRGGCAWAASVDRGAGVVAVCTATGRVRVLREDADDAAAWAECLAGVARVIAPEAPPRLPAQGGLALGPGLTLPEGTGGQEKWLAEHGVAWGAALAAVGPSAELHGACGMTPQAPVPYRPALVRAADALTPARRAWTVLAACAVLLLLGPWALAWTRHAILKGQAAASGEDDAESVFAQKQAEHAQMLKDRRWPMTKLLADLTGAMPAGITLETVSLEYGQPVRVTGAAESPDLVSQWRAALDKSRVFADVRAPSVEAARFELTARVAQPFGANSVLVAKPPASNGTAGTPPGPRPSGGGGGGAGGTRGGARGSGQSAPAASAAATPAAKAPPPVPGAITDAQIEAMDLPTATREWGQRKAAAGRPGVSETDKSRLTSEADKLQARRKALQSAAGGGS